MSKRFLRNAGLAILLLMVTGIYMPHGVLAQDSKGENPLQTGLVWPSQPPADCPFQPSDTLTGIKFTGKHSDYYLADTWYPSWASDGNLYSPYTDGSCPRLDGSREDSNSSRGEYATTGQAVLEGDDPLHLKIYSLGLQEASALPYKGRYPCGSLVHNGVWYYGTYCLAPEGSTPYGDFVYNWPWLGPLVGFRISTDYGRTWQETTHTPAKPLFGETGMWGHPVNPLFSQSLVNRGISVVFWNGIILGAGDIPIPALQAREFKPDTLTRPFFYSNPEMETDLCIRDTLHITILNRIYHTQIRNGMPCFKFQ